MNKEKNFNTAGQSLIRLVQIAAILRGENGCVWDKEQTIFSLKPFLLEECYELLAAIDEEGIDKEGNNNSQNLQTANKLRINYPDVGVQEYLIQTY